ncbi:hypothetical protein COCNU_06G019400 [Cocos nucifera]|uniref:Flavin-containing monooxygenase n=1 Tax=Cocos nucifera TaxID=13894 RepID=A0A8K0N3X6_COCNU|nr:hypothetical protein COCNU_06G019400 [Cocos nucifera]
MSHFKIPFNYTICIKDFYTINYTICIKHFKIPSLILERSDCIASLWQKRTYDRLKLHLPKQFCQLPKLPFPADYPDYPSKEEFLRYLESYANHFKINPRFMQPARCDETCGLWRVRTVGTSAEAGNWNAEVEYIGRWLVVAAGENAPKLEGPARFGGDVTRVCEYKSGDVYRGKRVLVVGCGNSGMEVCLDLCDHDAFPSMVVRDSIGEWSLLKDQNSGNFFCLFQNRILCFSNAARI